ncbi:hypothetical protein GYMLUDRAFT_60704 [Collybiopsis luxurians FD-317 M1]|uniref:Unplaced genomic scaffold GYMLUscaffold_37, whole genome shotgun sequence n=1 Tax=Collybiopsis luxurians FD-317 M1 TaxID=944289 RepID=A0A0D0B4Y6_9AGAR|nr:hypothetical protein GYMLUDRAFT_60704 [Collybiopsis luxurians FD-317 M1]
MKVDPSSSSATLSFDSSGTPFDFMSALGLGAESTAINNATNMAIDPQLVDSPKEGPSGDGADDTNEPSTDSLPPAKHTRSASSSSSSPSASSPVDGKEKLTLTIAPVKVGGHGKAGRKGTVQSGGIPQQLP